MRRNTKRSRELAWLAGVLAVGLALRVCRLGALGLAWNEDYLAITVRSILADGIPDFPSGLLYVRALPLSYLTAGLAQIFGSNEVVLRAPSVVFSLLGLTGVYLLGRRLTSPRVALLAMLLMAVSDWEIEVARTARMYAMLSASCLLCLALLREALERRSRWLGAAAVGFAALASMTHQIGLVLVPMALCFLLYRRPDRWQTRLLACCVAVVSLGFGANLLVASSQYGKWSAVVAAVRAQAPVDLPTPDPEPAEAAGEAFTGRYLPPFLTLQESHRGAFLAVTGLVGALLLVLAWTAVRHRGIRLFVPFLAAVIVALYLQQLLLAGILLVAYAFIGRLREPTVAWRRSVTLAALILAVSACWVAFWLGAAPDAATAGEAGVLEAAKDLLKPLVGYPPLFLREIFARYPLMSLLAVVASGVAAVRFWRHRRVDGLGLLVLLFVVPSVGLGFHPEALQRFDERYVFFADPYFLLLVAFGALWIGERLWRGLARRRRLRLAVVGLYLLALLVLTGFANARASLALVTAEYGVDHGGRGLYPDLAGPARFVRDHYQTSDIVISMDILGTYAYLPVAHYQLSLFGKPDAEAWIGAHSLTGARALSDALARHRGARVWIILAAQHLRHFEHDPEMEAILRLIAGGAGEPSYRGRDGLSDVYLVEPQAARPEPSPSHSGQGSRS